jgi:hypothetical protein
MENNVRLNPGADGPLIATEEIGGAQIQRVKLVLGTSGADEGDASSTNPVPVYQQPFKPIYGAGQSLSAAAVAASADLAASKQVCVTNTGLNIAYIKIGTGVITASDVDYPILPGSKEIITKAVGDDKLSHISADGTTLHVITGEGN